MKLRNILFALALGASAFASQGDGLRIERKYVLNDSDIYVMKMQMDSPVGPIDLSMDMKETVKKLYDNGDADIESTVSNMVVNVQGREQRPPNTQKGTTVRYTKYGTPVPGQKTGQGMNGMNFMQFGNLMGENSLKVGETRTFDQADKDNPKNHIKGTVKLDSNENGVAKLITSVDIFQNGAEKPMHVDATSWIETSIGKMKKYEGKVTNLPMGGGAGAGMPSSASFTLERKS